MIYQTVALRYQAIRAQIAYLRSPERKDGPSRYEAEEAAAYLEKEANALSEHLYWDSAEKNFNQYLK